MIKIRDIVLISKKVDKRVLAIRAMEKKMAAYRKMVELKTAQAG